VDVGGRADDQQVDVNERRQRTVHRVEVGLAVGGQRSRDLLGDPARVVEPRLVDDE
jgi:hypothetical protein